MSEKKVSKDTDSKAVTGILRIRGLFVKSHNVSPIITLIGIVIVFLYANVIMRGNSNALLIYVPYLVWILLAESWNVAGGYAGLLNLGLVAFFGLGSVITGLSMVAGIPYSEALVLSGFSGALLAVAMIPTFRLKSDYFAIATLVLPFIIKPLAELIGRSSDYSTPAKYILSPLAYFNLGMFLVAATIFGIFFLIRSRVGIALRAVGDNEVASASLGVNVMLYKTAALVASGFIGAFAGGYFLQHFSFSTISFEDLTYSLFPIFMVIVGGIGTFEGPIIGALIFSWISITLNTYFPGTAYAYLLFSIVIIVIAVLLPKGIVPSAIRALKKITKRYS